MRVYFISTWSSESGLSNATVHPHLDQLASDSRVDEIVYFSVESLSGAKYMEATGKVLHCPVVQDKVSIPILSSALKHWATTHEILEMAANKRPDLVICRGAPAGIYGYKLWRRFGTPYYVESFEPHAEYMRQSGTWTRFDVKYLIQNRWEALVKKTASGLITVSDGYADFLIEKEDLPADKVLSVPCWVDSIKFDFDSEVRSVIRKRLGIEDALTCVYLGKFGGLYYDEEAFRAFGVIQNQVGGSLFLILLTSSDKKYVRKLLQKYGFEKHQYIIELVPHESISDYLSAADFAISFHKSIPLAFSFSPIKYGEYWACGLPVLAPEGVGDESSWIEKECVGGVADFLDESSINEALERIIQIMSDADHRNKIRKVSLVRRNKSHLIVTYREIIDSFYNSSKATHH